MSEDEYRDRINNPGKYLEQRWSANPGDREAKRLSLVFDYAARAEEIARLKANPGAPDTYNVLDEHRRNF